MNSEIKAMVKGSEEVFFGKGTAELLECIEKTGTVRTAAQYMGLSYSKARHMLSHFHTATGKEAVAVTRGGEGGGRAELTEYGKAFLTAFREYEKRSQSAAEELFQECFRGLM